jgi:hypothetical protein
MDPLPLFQDEIVYHQDAVKLKKMLEAYHASESRDEKAWRDQFKEFLVCLK